MKNNNLVIVVKKKKWTWNWKIKILHVEIALGSRDEFVIACIETRTGGYRHRLAPATWPSVARFRAL